MFYLHLQSMKVTPITNSTVLYITAGFTFSREKHDVHPSRFMIVKSGRLGDYNICRASVMSSLALDFNSKYHVLVCNPRHYEYRTSHYENGVTQHPQQLSTLLLPFSKFYRYYVLLERVCYMAFPT